LPITVLEAMQSGVPIVATRVGGVPSVLDNGRGGALVQPGDPAALGEAIAQSLDDPQSARTRAAHAQRQSSERFSSEAMAHRYAALYDELTRHHR